MTNICGIMWLGKDQVFSANEIRAELATISNHQKDNFAVWFDANIGLIQKVKDSESKNKSNIYQSNKLIIVADTCLTNRTELLEKFGVLHSERPKYNSCEVILKSYEKWGEDCVEHLNGDFAFAIWDKINRKLFCAKDYMGGSQLFYYKDSKKFIFATTPQGILNFKGVEKKFNKNKLAYFLLPEPHTLTLEESWFENIFPLPAGTVLKVDQDGIQTRKYWQPEIREKLPYKNNAEILEAFRELMFETIEAPLDEFDNVTALLSGGLDSSAIVSVAAKALEIKNKELTVFSSVLADANDPDFQDERFYIDQFKSFPNIKIKYISAPEFGPFTNLEELAESNDSPIITSRHYLYTDFLKEADKVNSSTIIEGSYGEFGPTNYSESGFAEMLSKFKFRTLWDELNKRKHLYGESKMYNFRANALNPIIPAFIKNLKPKNADREIKLNANHPLQSQLFQELLTKTELHKCSVKSLHKDHRISQLANFTFLHQKISDFPSINIQNLPVEYRYPFLNKKLLEFCLAAPLELKIHDGYTRYLMRLGLDKILPPKIQWRTSKTPFSPDYIRRYYSQIESIRELLADIKPNDPICEILDIERIKNWVDLSIKENESYTNNKLAFDIIPQAIYLIYFLRRFSEFKS